MKLFFLSFSIFFITIFALNSFFWAHNFSDSEYGYEYEDEDIFILPEYEEAEITKSLLETAPESAEQIEEIKNRNVISFRYSPEGFQEEAEDIYAKWIAEMLNSDIFLSKIEDLLVIFYEDAYHIRGNMKNKIIRLHDSDRIGEAETLAVFLHELAHYIDLYHFKKQDNYDLSYEFYSISWLSTKIALWGQDETDFVSGYAATNAYEDFSESFLYYVLHNREFLRKAEASEKLQEKYNFFRERLFYDWTFEKSSFSLSDHAEYNWDITKLEFSLENFLDYLKKSI